MLIDYFLLLAELHLGVECPLKGKLLSDEGGRSDLFLEQVPPQHY
jgi:hypothetical protein